MSGLARLLATAFYRQAARLSARQLACSPAVQSVLLHRSVATGEVSFGRSDIDMLLVLDEEQAADGARVAELYRQVKRAQRLNPALNHLDVFDADGLVRQMEMDTFWASVERRAWMLLAGRPVEFPAAAVRPDHSAGKFLQWAEWYFALAVQQRNRRNLWKTALECWNAYACAAGLLDEPLLTRNEMEDHARRNEPALAAKRLHEPQYAARFVFELADRLHRARRPPLRTLGQPLIFDAITAPICLPRRFVVVPHADSVLPAAAFEDGAWPCTPEVLDLFVHTRNAFLHWALPPALLDLGIRPPGAAGFLSACRHYGHQRFLFLPGFGVTHPPQQDARLALLRHAAEWASRGETPPPVGTEKILDMTAAGSPPAEEYYRTEYGRLLEESRRIGELAWRGLESSARPGPGT